MGGEGGRGGREGREGGRGESERERLQDCTVFMYTYAFLFTPCMHAHTYTHAHVSMRTHKRCGLEKFRVLTEGKERAEDGGSREEAETGILNETGPPRHSRQLYLPFDDNR